MRNNFLEEHLKKINSILSWFNQLSKKLNFEYWLDLTTLSKIYYDNNLDKIKNIHISLESKYFDNLILYFIQNKIQFKSPKYLFTKTNYLQLNDISSYIEVEELIIYFFKKEDNNLMNNKLGLKIEYDIIYELKKLNYNEEEYSIPNNIEKYLEILNLKKKDNNNENKLSNKLDNILSKKNNENYLLKKNNIIEEIPKNIEIIFPIKEKTILDKILNQRDKYWEKYEKSLKNQKEIEELNMAKNIDRKTQVIPKFFSL
jgi:hypothetical protein